MLCQPFYIFALPMRRVLGWTRWQQERLQVWQFLECGSSLENTLNGTTACAGEQTRTAKSLRCTHLPMHVIGLGSSPVASRLHSCRPRCTVPQSHLRTPSDFLNIGFYMPCLVLNEKCLDFQIFRHRETKLWGQDCRVYGG